MNVNERLAREICWKGFRHPLATQGKTKASYWKSISESARQNYRYEASQFIYTLNRLPRALIEEIRRR